MCLTACLLNQNGDFAYNMVRSLCLKVSSDPDMLLQ